MTVSSAKEKTSQTVKVEIMGKQHYVPEGLTMLQAMWHTGHELTRGVGCLGGICGACPSKYTTPEDAKIKTALACQTQVEEGMSFSLTAAYYPNRKVVSDFKKMEDPKQEIFRLYPETALCRNCDACTQACPKGIDVRTGVWKAAFGQFKEGADLFLSCVMCSLCVPVCIADIAPNQVGLYMRRAQGIFFNEKSSHLLARLEEIEQGKFDAEWEQLLSLSDEAITSKPLA
ncbi:4Fe-4S ferredoxin, iron-sulfur binding domain protein [hydrothermal vent metagenome]|uniref:4Fe-4S ferredoxin, iron-sulfur binding domain protein n=1 Tax=hydrothermal vent metagenome TaxID=652676 RepID=A0A3B1CUN0_9ZZZZ